MGNLVESTDPYGDKCPSAKAPTRTLNNVQRVASQAWSHWRSKWETGINEVLFAAIRYPRRRRLFRECRPSRRGLSSYGTRWNPFMSLDVNCCIRSKQSALTIQFGEQVGRIYSRYQGLLNHSHLAVISIISQPNKKKQTKCMGNLGTSCLVSGSLYFALME